MPDRSFRALGVSEPIVRTLADRSIHTPFRIQTLVLPDALAGLDVVAQSPTGSGKTLAFAVPIVERTDPATTPSAALVLVPTRELAVQVTEEFAPLVGVRDSGGDGLRRRCRSPPRPRPPAARTSWWRRPGG